MMSVSFALIALTVVGLLVLGGIVLVVMLLAHERTRVVGLGLLLAGLGAMFFGFIALFFVRMEGSRLVERGTHMRPVTADARARQLVESPQGKDASREENQKMVVDASAKTAAGRLDSGKILRALGRSVSKAIADAKKKSAAPATDEKPPTAAVEKSQPPSAPERPAWVDGSPKRADDVYQMTATVGPYTTRLECDQALPDELEKALADYVETYLGRRARGRVGLSPDYLRDHVVKADWEETRQTSVGPMIQLHVLLEFDSQVNDRLKERWRETVILERLGYLGAGVLAVLAVLAMLFSYLKIDLATGGVYRGRLKLAAIAVILAIVAAGALVLTA